MLYSGIIINILWFKPLQVSVLLVCPLSHSSFWLVLQLCHHCLSNMMLVLRYDPTLPSTLVNVLRHVMLVCCPLLFISPTVLWCSCFQFHFLFQTVNFLVSVHMPDSHVLMSLLLPSSAVIPLCVASQQKQFTICWYPLFITFTCKHKCSNANSSTSLLRVRGYVYILNLVHTIK